MIMQTQGYLNDRYIPMNLSRVFFFVAAMLAAFHVPIIWVQFNESIGLFDIFVIFSLFAILIAQVLGQPIYINRKWNEYLIILFIYIGFLFLSFLLNFEKTRPLLLFFKHIEHSLFLIILLQYFESNKDDIPNIINIVQFSLLLLVLYQLYYYFTRTPVVGVIWFRIGLPYMKGTSSNPAGFVLGVSVILYISVIFKIKKRSIFTIGTFLLILVSMAFTLSRTNILGLIIIVILYFLSNIVKSSKAIIIAVLVFVGTFAIFSILTTYLARQSYMFQSIVAIMTNPEKIFAEHSFIARYASNWPEAINAWLKNGVTVLFGNGIEYIRVADNTLLRLLANQGIVGTLLFGYLWVGFFLMKYGYIKWLRILLLFVLINSINADTLITSYRSIQMYLVLLLTFIYSSEYLQKIEDSKKTGMP